MAVVGRWPLQGVRGSIMISVFKYLCWVCVGREEGGGEHNVYCAKFKAIVLYNDNLIINNMYR